MIATKEKYKDVELIDFGEVIIDLLPIMRRKNISTYSLSKGTMMKWDYINRYCTQDIYRLDLSTLAKLCFVLHCEPKDIIKYIPPRN